MTSKLVNQAAQVDSVITKIPSGRPELNVNPTDAGLTLFAGLGGFCTGILSGLLADIVFENNLKGKLIWKTLSLLAGLGIAAVDTLTKPPSSPEVSIGIIFGLSESAGALVMLVDELRRRRSSRQT